MEAVARTKRMLRLFFMYHNDKEVISVIGMFSMFINTAIRLREGIKICN